MADGQHQQRAATSSNNVRASGSDAPLVGTSVGRFAVRELLGIGAMGEVYRADDTRLHRSVALKRMAPRLRADEHYRERFLKEAERASCLSDPHIAAVYDVLEESGEIFLVMEYVDGETLRRRTGYPLPLGEFLTIGRQCAEALASAHAEGVVHCDIKPENIMMTASGRVKILDFGLAKVRAAPGDDKTVDGMASAAAVGGTPGYAAPEIMLRKEFDGRADLFSLGVVFYELLTGEKPFAAGSPVGAAVRVVHERQAPMRRFNPDLPPALEDIVAKLLEKEPEARYANASELLEDLQRLESERLPARVWRRLARPWVAVVALVIVLIGVLALAPALRRRAALAVGLVEPIPAQKHVAVLPFNNLSGNAGDEALCRGLAWVLANKLGQIEQFQGELLVVSASDVFRNRVASAREAREQFGANLAITGSLQRTEGRMRITAELVDTASLRQLRSDSLDASESEASLLQDDIALKVAGLLEFELRPQSRGILATRSTMVARASDFFLQGRGYMQNYDRPENIDNAIGLLRRAIELDPRLAGAHAALGEAYWRKYDHTKDVQWLQQAREGCEKGASLDPALAAARTCLGTVAVATGRYEDAVKEFRSATEIDPSSDEAHRGLALAHERLGRMKEAEETYRHAIELRRSYWGGYSALGRFYFTQARYADAARAFEQVVALVPDSFLGYRNLGAAYALQGRYAEAITALQRSVTIRPTWQAYSNLGTAYFNLRRFNDSVFSFELASQMAEREYVVWGNLGDAYYFSSERRDKAPGAYEKAIALAIERLKVNPRDARVMGSTAVYSAMLNRRSAAASYLRQALTLAGDDPDLLVKAARVYGQLGEPAKGLEFLSRAVAARASLPDLRDSAVYDVLRSAAGFEKIVSRAEAGGA